MNNNQTFQQWLDEISLYEYSKENYEITQLIGEINLCEMALASAEFMESNPGVLMEDVAAGKELVAQKPKPPEPEVLDADEIPRGAKNAQKQKLKDRVASGAKSALKKIWAAIKKFFIILGKTLKRFAQGAGHVLSTTASAALLTPIVGAANIKNGVMDKEAPEEKKAKFRELLAEYNQDILEHRKSVFKDSSRPDPFQSVDTLNEILNDNAFMAIFRDSCSINHYFGVKTGKGQGVDVFGAATVRMSHVDVPHVLTGGNLVDKKKHQNSNYFKFTTLIKGIIEMKEELVKMSDSGGITFEKSATETFIRKAGAAAKSIGRADEKAAILPEQTVTFITKISKVENLLHGIYELDINLLEINYEESDSNLVSRYISAMNQLQKVTIGLGHQLVEESKMIFDHNKYAISRGRKLYADVLKIV